MTMTLGQAFTIAEVVTASDFVLQLNTGVERAEQTVGEYVVTESLAGAFDAALDEIGSALSQGVSQGAFIHGSFGSGKSHFMAVLDLILRGSPSARALPGLQQAISKHRDVLDASLLTVEYHLIGATSLEDALFAGYLHAVDQRHPGATAPVLHRSDLLLDDALTRMQDSPESFFSALNGAGGDDGWGDFGGSWDEASVRAAAAAPVGDPDRDRLVTDLTATMFTGYSAAGEWLDISAGLAAMSAHAKGLGYDGLVLFLDELVLWLASHLADSNFVSVEGSKVAKLVEQGVGVQGAAGRAIPIVSFVARQRNLQEFLGERAAVSGGAERMAIGETFRWWEDRFDSIELVSADLPKIAHRRLLQPRNEAAAQSIEQAVVAIKRDASAYDVLLSGDLPAGEAEFAQMYPFSPALVDALVRLAPMMQRERTGLKVMAQLLSKGRDTLVIDDIIPVGDLYDFVVTEGSNPLTPDLKVLFENARTLYETKLRRTLLQRHNLTEEAAKGLDRDAAFSRDNRLAKTLLLAALIPDAKSLGGLTPQRLAALNHGTVRARVAGNEARIVHQKVREWAESIGEISIGEGDNPVISLDLSGVDYDSVLERVANEDTEGARRRLLKSMLFEQFGISEDNSLYGSSSVATVWRGTKRRVDVLFGNIRDTAELPDGVFAAEGDTWRIVIDFPFDKGHTPKDDLARMDELGLSMQTRTVAWMPGFLTNARMEDLGLLVKLDYLLGGTGQHFAEHSLQLPPEQRPIAKEQLENRRSAVRASMNEVLKQAYGVATPKPADIDVSQYGDMPPFASLQTDFTPQPPVGADLGKAMENLVHQMLDNQYPDHPRFDPGGQEVTNANLAVVLEHVRLAVANGGRVDPVETNKRPVLRRVANPLKCGQAFENHYVFDIATFEWRNRFIKWAVQDEFNDEIPVNRVREWFKPFGMTREVENLLILAWALLDDKEFARHGATVQVAAGRDVRDEYVLRSPVLPSSQAWETALHRAAVVLGQTASPQGLTAANVRTLATAVRDRAKAARNDVAEVLSQLTKHREVLGLDDGSPRMVDAVLASDLIGRLAAESDDLVVINVLAEAALPAEPQSIGTSIEKAPAVAAALKGASWTVLNQGPVLMQGRDDRARQILETLYESSRASELHRSLQPALGAAAEGIVKLLTAPKPGPTDPPKDDAVTRRRLDAITLDGVESILSTLGAEIAQELGRNTGKKVRIEWWLE